MVADRSESLYSDMMRRYCTFNGMQHANHVHHLTKILSVDIGALTLLLDLSMLAITIFCVTLGFVFTVTCSVTCSDTCFNV